MRLFFNLKDSHDTIPDLEGVEVEDISQAWAQATEAIQEMRRSGGVEDWSGWTLSVTDAAGQVVLVIDLGRDIPTHG